MAKAVKKRARRLTTQNPAQLHSAVASVLFEVVGQHVQSDTETEARLAIAQAEALETVFGVNLGRRG